MPSSRQSTRYGTDDAEDGGCDGGGEAGWGAMCRRLMEGADEICVSILVMNDTNTGEVLVHCLE